MSYPKKLAVALRELEDAKVNKINAMPPPYIILRKLGIEIVPFHYNRFSSNFIIASVWFFPISYLLAFWHLDDVSNTTIFNVSVFSGVMLGLCTAVYYSNSAKKYKLSTWEQL
ncbi:DUF6404 family protein [Pseudoalteromonas luteoviolacea]|uniref:DUF6404 family protein n=1 Tax=Pseudoalteromonas luteoviolacea TaxID=43657 RepID=UPI001F2FFEEE|nr:DUF6404 family protein [Pseudoalteromonas luteoviolacea]MCF6443021.1 DUF6404 family protein [Pseudoalteromonas luteoviolacea]